MTHTDHINLTRTLNRATFRDYLETALWSSTDTDGGFLDSRAYPLSFGCLLALYRDYLTALNDARANGLLEKFLRAPSGASFGGNLWLTRNRHGAGFWDLGLGTLGEELSDWARSQGSIDLYVGDDGKVHSTLERF